jgi:hypothetical protein
MDILIFHGPCRDLKTTQAHACVIEMNAAGRGDYHYHQAFERPVANNLANIVLYDAAFFPPTKLDFAMSVIS